MRTVLIGASLIAVLLSAGYAICSDTPAKRSNEPVVMVPNTACAAPHRLVCSRIRDYLVCFCR